MSDDDINKYKKISYEDSYEETLKYDDDDDYDIEYDNDEYNYKEETLNLIQKSLLEYVELNYLPLCEYLTIEKISKFIDKL